MLAVTSAMKSRQMRAGIVPPNTDEKPSTFTRGVSSSSGYPTQTHAASCGTYPQNQAST